MVKHIDVNDCYFEPREGFTDPDQSNGVGGFGLSHYAVIPLEYFMPSADPKKTAECLARVEKFAAEKAKALNAIGGLDK